MTEVELILLALNNYHNRRIISREEQNKVFIFYMKNLHKKGLSVELYFPFLKEEAESMCCGAELSISEKNHIVRKVKEYLSQAERRVKKLRK